MPWYHTSPRENRESILEKGLLARDTTEWRYPYHARNTGRAVYVSLDPYSPGEDVWLVDIWGLPFENDRVLKNSLRVLCNIPLARLTLEVS